MWIIGLLLLAAAIVVGIEIGISNDRQVDIEAFNQVWTSNPAAAFLVGVVTALVGAFGLWLMFVGLRRSRVRSRRRRAEIAERDRLADERRRELEAMGATGGGDRDDRTVAADHGDGNPDRERVSQTDHDAVDLRDEPEAEHHERHGLLHRSDR
jgi:uncharacterized membrane protein YciS (DUF1049 family)